MRRYSIVSQILLSLLVITFALAAPVTVQEKRQAPEIAVLRKRIGEPELNMLHDPLEHMWGTQDRADAAAAAAAAAAHPQEPPPPPNLPPASQAKVHVPPQAPAGPSMLHDPLGYYEYMWGAQDRAAAAGVPPNPAKAHVPAYVPPQGPSMRHDPYDAWYLEELWASRERAAAAKAGVHPNEPAPPSPGSSTANGPSAIN